MLLCHNQLRDVDLCHKANFGVKFEAGSAPTPDRFRPCPADALVKDGWYLSIFQVSGCFYII